jgi:hypothetical protein
MTMPQPLPWPYLPSSGRVLVGPSFSSLRGSFKRVLRASTSSRSESSGQDNDNLKTARETLARKQKILDSADQVVDSLLMELPRPSPNRIAEAKLDVADAKLDVAEAERDVAEAERDVAEAERDVAKAALEEFLKNNPRPSSSDVAAIRAFEVNEARFKHDLAQAGWNLSRADLAFAQARSAPDIDLEQKRKAEEIFRAAFERLVATQSPGQSTTFGSLL